ELRQNITYHIIYKKEEEEKERERKDLSDEMMDLTEIGFVNICRST
ncbi:10385_t:CDS:1, partial [Acaulospora colombiana]